MCLAGAFLEYWACEWRGVSVLSEDMNGWRGNSSFLTDLRSPGSNASHFSEICCWAGEEGVETVNILRL
jgi:hypothetical protein